MWETYGQKKIVEMGSKISIETINVNRLHFSVKRQTVTLGKNL